MQLLNYFWNQLNFDEISPASQLRIKELLLILGSVNHDFQKVNESSITKKDSEIREWVEELISLVDSGQYNVFACKLLIQQAQALINGEQEKTLLSLEASAKVLELIEQYQKSPDPLQWTNFGGQIYLESVLSRKIELLYQIGELAKIVGPDETFNSRTRVTKVTQEVCNKVCSWVENYLELKLNYINIYEPFIEDYKKYTYERNRMLKEIGTRSGLLPEELLNNSNNISVAEAKLVIDWVNTNLNIELVLPKECEPESEVAHRAPHNLFYSLIGIVGILILAVVPLFYTYFQFDEQFVEQPELMPNKPLLKREIKKQTVPIKRIQPKSKSTAEE